MNSIVIYGAGGHAKVTAEIAHNNGFVTECFVDLVENSAIWNIPVVTTLTEPQAALPAIIAIGSNHLRKKIVEEITAVFCSLAHPKANISKHTTIGEGTVIMAGATVNADTVVGKHCIINTNASIDHDCQIGDYVHISPNATLCGSITIGEGTHIGAGATIIPNILVGKNCIVGAGSVIIRNIPDNCVVVGNPARVIKQL